MSGLEIYRKRNYHIFRWLTAGVLLVVFALYGYFGVRWYSTGEMSPLPLPVAALSGVGADESMVSDRNVLMHTAAATEPRYIEIPKLGINKIRVNTVGITERKMLEMPLNIHDAGWYGKSAKPGSDAGAVLLTGHGKGTKRAGAFNKLSGLIKGDEITIERGDGKKFSYEVTDVRTMPVSWVTKTGMKEMMYSVDPTKEGISLVTDAGKWIPKDHVYDKRVLVRGTIVTR